ncbi:ABC transporter ATP-binding protein [Spiroplasma clarkii]|nr:ABC transporter ATP-binding protein [Spiroplasma clarkii]
MTCIQTGGTTTFIVWDFSLQHWIIFQVCLFVLLGFCFFALNFSVGTLGKRIETYLRNETLKALILQDISYYSNKKIGEILTKIGTDTWIIGEQTQNIPTLILLAIFNFVGSSIVLISIDWRLGLIAMSFVTLGLSSMFLFFSRIKKWIVQLRTTITYVNGDITDRIATIRLIKASGTEVYEKQRFRDIHVEFFQTVKAFLED